MEQHFGFEKSRLLHRMAAAEPARSRPDPSSYAVLIGDSCSALGIVVVGDTLEAMEGRDRY
jgi:hypothetical protein